MNNINQPPDYSGGLTFLPMKQQFLKALETVSDVLGTAGAVSEFEDLNSEEQEFFDVLMLCYDLLSRTSISKNILVPQPEEMKEHGFEDDFIPKYGIASDALADFAFSVATKSGAVDLRKLLYRVMAPHRQQDLANDAGIRRQTISEYINGHKSMTTDNYEKIINATLKNEK